MFLKFFANLSEQDFEILRQLFASSSYHSPILLERIRQEDLHHFSKNIFQVLDSDDKEYFWFEWQKINSEDETIKVQLTKKGSEFLRRNKDFYLNHRLYRFTKIRSKYTKLFLPHLLQMESQEYGYRRDEKFTLNQLRKILQIKKNQYAKESDFIKRCLDPIERDFPDDDFYAYGNETVYMEFEKIGKRFRVRSNI